MRSDSQEVLSDCELGDFAQEYADFLYESTGHITLNLIGMQL